MEGSVKDLSMYRFESAGDDLESARLLLRMESLKHPLTVHIMQSSMRCVQAP